MSQDEWFDMTAVDDTAWDLIFDHIQKKEEALVEDKCVNADKEAPFNMPNFAPYSDAYKQERARMVRSATSKIHPWPYCNVHRQNCELVFDVLGQGWWKCPCMSKMRTNSIITEKDMERPQR